jgi:hypothetical protein
MIVIKIINDVTGDEKTKNYHYEVTVNHKNIVEGVVMGIPRMDHWVGLLRELFMGASISKDIKPETVQSYTPPPVPLEKQQDRYISDREVSRITGIGLGTLRNDRFKRKGIPYVKPSPRMCRYKLSDVLAYMEKHRMDMEKQHKKR